MKKLSNDLFKELTNEEMQINEGGAQPGLPAPGKGQPVLIGPMPCFCLPGKTWAGNPVRP
ncbi:MAG: hypothetical protein FWC71_11530 [Defluviitaleaceae bacterium]|nr:hypothetical protein [Defluviitaleaceae bacterium]